MGLLDFLGFGKRHKPNLTPSFGYPEQKNLFFQSDDAKQGGYSLRELAKSRIKAGQTGEITPGIGYGSDFVSRTANPAIAKLDARFRESTVPRISSEASKRGLGRSTLVTNEIGRASQEVDRDVADLVSKFYQLNKMQEKTDINQGISLGQDLDTQERSMLSDQAAASERQVGRNIVQDDKYNTERQSRQNASIGALMNLAVPGSRSAYQMANTPSVSSGGSAGSSILGKSDMDFESWLDSLLG